MYLYMIIEMNKILKRNKNFIKNIQFVYIPIDLLCKIKYFEFYYTFLC